MSLSNYQCISTEVKSTSLLCNTPICSTKTYSSKASLSIDSIVCWIFLSESNYWFNYQIGLECSNQRDGWDSQCISNYSSVDWFQPTSNYK